MSAALAIGAASMAAPDLRAVRRQPSFGVALLMIATVIDVGLRLRPEQLVRTRSPILEALG